MPDLPLDHIGIAVRSIDASRRIYEKLSGAAGGATLEVPDHGVNVAFVGDVELLEPRGPDSPVARFLADRGPGLHHIAYRVEDLGVALERAVQKGFEPVDPVTRPGAQGHRIAFLHPRSTGGVLVELVERPKDPT